MVFAPVALLPVLLFLLVLRMIDSYALVPAREILRALLAGCLVAAVFWLLNPELGARLPLDEMAYRRYVAPFLEEAGKALFVGWLILSARTGFLVDAAILGFAVGAGFALVENVAYLLDLPNSTIWLWGVRGFGTAIMHGAATSMFAIIGKGLTDRHHDNPGPWLLPGLLLASFVHSAFNHFPFGAVATALTMLVTMPLLLAAVFARSEQATREWLGTGFDDDAKVLESLMSAEFPDSPVGRYLETLRERFPGEMIVDLLCLLRLHLELSVRAKGILLAREAGLDVPVGDDVRAKLDEIAVLEKSIGTTGRLALHPVRRMSRRDLWELYVLGK
jgi:RsiW-degrading membrane proteinase PrsW (M82 family)